MARVGRTGARESSATLLVATILLLVGLVPIASTSLRPWVPSDVRSVLAGHAGTTGARSVGPPPSSTSSSSPAAGVQLPADDHPSSNVPIWTNQTGHLSCAPSARAGPSMAYDSARGVVVLFGGYNEANTWYNDTWEFANGSWNDVSQQVGPAPAGRASAAIADDPSDGGLLLWGGVGPFAYGHDAADVNDTWLLNVTGWHNLTARSGTPPPASRTATMAWDATDRYVLLYDQISISKWGTWAFVNRTWTRVAVNTTAAPTGTGESMAYDPTAHAVVLYTPTADASGSDSTWEYAHGNWTDRQSPLGLALSGAGMAFDAADNETLLFGGAPSKHGYYNIPADLTWAFQNDTWVNLSSTVGTPPPGRTNLAIAFDLRDDYVVLFGGLDGAAFGNVLGDTWTFGLFGPGNPPTLTVSIKATPRATDVGVPAQFSALLSGADLPPFFYNWSFGDGLTANGSAALHAFDLAGVYVVSVVVTDTHFGSAERSLSERVNARPLASATASPTFADVGEPFAFNGSVVNGTPPYRWNWSFGDGSFGAGPAAEHLYSLAGNFTFTLTVVDAVGIPSYHGGFVRVATAPTARFTASPAVTDVGVPVVFTAVPGGGTAPFVYGWTLNGGAEASSPVIAPVFATPGTVVVDLTVTDATGAVAGWVGTEVVHPQLRLSAGVSTPGTFEGRAAGGNLSTPFVFGAVPAGGTEPYTLRWELSDGTQSSAGVLTHLFGSPGGYSGYVVVTDVVGATARGFVNVTVTASPPPPTPHGPSGNGTGSAGWAVFAPYLLIVAIVAAAGVAYGVMRRGRRPSVRAPDEGAESEAGEDE